MSVAGINVLVDETRAIGEGRRAPLLTSWGEPSEIFWP